MVDRAEIKSFTDLINLGVVSSLKVDQPQSAVVVVTFIPEKFEFIVGTSVKSRKFKNISNHPKVSVAMWHDKVTLQLEGLVEIIGRENSIFEELQKRIIEIHPYKKIFANDPDQVWVIVRPNWLRLTDISTNPWQIKEEKIK